MNKNNFTSRQLAVVFLSLLAVIALAILPWIGSELAFATVFILLFVTMFLVLLAVERNGLAERQKLDKLSSKFDRASGKLLSSKTKVLSNESLKETGAVQEKSSATGEPERTNSDNLPRAFQTFAKFLEDVDGLTSEAWISATQVVSLRRIDRWLQPEVIFATNLRLKNELKQALGTEVFLLENEGTVQGNARLLVLQRSEMHSLNEALMLDNTLMGCALAVVDDGTQNDEVPSQYVEAMPFDLLHKVKFYYPADLLIDEQVLNSKDEEASNYELN